LAVDEQIGFQTVESPEGAFSDCILKHFQQVTNPCWSPFPRWITWQVRSNLLNPSLYLF